MHPDPIRTLLVEPNRVEPHGGVGVGVLETLDLVEQLCSDRAHGDRATGAGVLGDDRRTVVLDLGDGEARVFEPGDLLEERVVAAGALRAAFDDVTCHDRAGELVPVHPRPAVVPGSRADDDGGVGYPSGHDDVGPARQALRRRPIPRGRRWR